MNNPTKALVLLFLAAALLLAGCVKVEDDKQYSEVEDLDDLGISEDTQADAVTGAAVADVAAEPTKPAEAPVKLEGASQITVREGQLVEVKAKGTDLDNDPITYTFSAPLDKDGKWQTKEGDKGTYNIKVTASDGKTTTTKTVEIVVKEKNKAPMLDTIDEIEAKVGDTISFAPKATDANNDKLSFMYSGWMSSQDKKTAESDIGTHKVTVTVSDGELSDSQEVVVKVVPRNNAPVMEKISDISVKEGETISFEPKVIDPDGDKVTIAYSGWMSSPTKTTGYSDAGEYTVKITASDGQLEATQNVKITVVDKNRPVDLQIEFVIS